MRNISPYFIVVILLMQCDNDPSTQKVHHELAKNAQVNRNKNESFSQIPVKRISLNAIQSHLFTLREVDKLYVGIDSQKIIATISWNRYRHGMIYFIDPNHNIKYDSLDIDKYFKSVPTNHQYKYNLTETELLVNNKNRIKILLYGSGRGERSTNKYAVSDLGYPSNRIISEAVRNEYIVNDVDKVFFDQGITLIDDSVVNLYDLNNYKVIINDNKKRLYSVIGTAGFTRIDFGTKEKYDHIKFRPVDIFPRYDKLFFQTNSNIKGSETTLVSYDLKTASKKKYIFPVTATRFWFAKDCIFFSYNSADKKDKITDIQYSYIPY